MLLKDRKTRRLEGSTQVPRTTGTRPKIGMAPRTNWIGWIVAALVIVLVAVAILMMTTSGDGEEGASEPAPVVSTDPAGEPTGQSTEPLFTPEELRQMELLEEQRLSNRVGNQVP